MPKNKGAGGSICVILAFLLDFVQQSNEGGTLCSQEREERTDGVVSFPD